MNTIYRQRQTPLFIQGNPVGVKADSVINRSPEYSVRARP